MFFINVISDLETSDLIHHLARRLFHRKSVRAFIVSSPSSLLCIVSYYFCYLPPPFVVWGEPAAAVLFGQCPKIAVFPAKIRSGSMSTCLFDRCDPLWLFRRTNALLSFSEGRFIRIVLEKFCWKFRMNRWRLISIFAIYCFKKCFQKLELVLKLYLNMIYLN